MSATLASKQATPTVLDRYSKDGWRRDGLWPRICRRPVQPTSCAFASKESSFQIPCMKRDRDGCCLATRLAAMHAQRGSLPSPTWCILAGEKKHHGTGTHEYRGAALSQRFDFPSMARQE